MQGSTSDGFSIIVPTSIKLLPQEHKSSINERLIHNGRESTLICDNNNLNHTSPSKKPSYLNLSCSVSGYSNITTYDSKLRQDINKSREVSPIRPITNIIQYSKLERNNFLLIPVPIGNSLVLPDYSQAKTTNNIIGSEIIDKSKMSSDKNDSHDVTDTSSVFRSKQIFCTSSPESCVSSHYSSKKLFAVSSEKVNETDVVHTVTPSKSFIQQRVERLYGPGALAQGFFNYKRYKSKNDRLENQENIQISHSAIQSRSSKEDTVLQSKNSPDLPVFRHLRPEFCAQLPLASPKKDYKISKHSNKEIVDKNGITNNIDTPKANGALITRNKKTDTDENVESGLKIELSKNNNDVTKELEDNCTKSASNYNSWSKENNTPVLKDGHYFLNILSKERNRLLDLANKTELELESLQLSRQDISDEILGYLRSAAGKARLLATQKIQQFEGLCHNNLNRKDDEQFPTTSADLEGFWDMVMLQVVHIDTLFEDLNKMRQNNWEIIETECPASRKPAQPRRLNFNAGLSSSSSSKTSDKQNINREAAQKREEQRKKFVEMKRKAAREKKINVDNDNIEVFIPRS